MMSPRTWKPEVSAATERVSVRENGTNEYQSTLTAQSARLLSSRAGKQISSTLVDTSMPFSARSRPLTARSRPLTARSRPLTGRSSRLSEQAVLVDEAFRNCIRDESDRNLQDERHDMDHNDEDSLQKLCAEFREISRPESRAGPSAAPSAPATALDLEELLASMQQLGIGTSEELERDPEESTLRDSLEDDMLDDASSVRQLH